MTKFNKNNKLLSFSKHFRPSTCIIGVDITNNIEKIGMYVTVI